MRILQCNKRDIINGATMKSLFILLYLFSILSAETLISGIISKNSWWTKDKSPYVITNDVVIGPMARLVIDPGVEIIIEKPLKLPKEIEQLSSSDTFGVSIRILGALRCNGKPDSPIIFRGRYISEGDEYTHWEGILLNSTRSNEISIAYTNVHNAISGITVSRGTPIIRNTLLEKNNIGIKIDKSSSPRIVNSLFTDNFFSGIRVDKANPEIFNSIFYKNRNIGVYSDRISKISVLNCGFFGNGDKGAVGCSPEMLIMKKKSKNGDSTDVFGNLPIDPMFTGSTAETQAIKKKIKQLTEKSLKAPSTKDIQAIESPSRLSQGRKYYLSKHSPYVNAGNPANRFKEPDGSIADLGIWGGPEFLQF